METYERKNRIGKGTFGEAWLVHSKRSGRKYVIKEIRLEDMTEEDVEKARTEAIILNRCKHNNIIRYKDVFILPLPKRMCLVMEYADGGDLSGLVKAARVKGETFDERRILYWLIQIAFAVQYLHNNNILHRDLKTQNIFLTKSDLVKLGDFGIARFLRNKEDLATTAIGTPYYLSPEICHRRPYNHKSDMWALGCVLYEMCALRHPFEAENFNSLMIMIMTAAYRPLPKYWSSILRDLVSVLLRTTPDRRPSADQVLLIPALRPHVEKYLKVHQNLIDSAVEAASPGVGGESRQHQSSGGECKERERKRRRSSSGLKSLVPLKVRYMKHNIPDLPGSGIVRGRSASDSVLEQPQNSRTPEYTKSSLVSPSSCRRKSRPPDEVQNSPDGERDPRDQRTDVRTPEHETSSLLSPSSCKMKSRSSEEVPNSPNGEYVPRDQKVVMKTPWKSPAAACCSSPDSGVASPPGTLIPTEEFDFGKTLKSGCPDLPRSLTLKSEISSPPQSCFRPLKAGDPRRERVERGSEKIEAMVL